MQEDPALGDAGEVLTVTLRGVEDALVALRGQIDDSACARLGPMLRALLDAGARRLIVDLPPGAVVPAGLTRLLLSTCQALRLRGGWLIVEGRSESLDAVAPPLLEVFSAYRDAVAPARPSSRPPTVPAPRLAAAH